MATQALTLTEGWRARWGDPAPLADSRPGWLAPEFVQSLDPVPAGDRPVDGADQKLVWYAVPVPAADLNDPLLLLDIPNSGAIEVWAAGERIFASGEVLADGTVRIDHLGAHVVPLPPRAMGEWLLVRIQGDSSPYGLRSARLGQGRDLLAAEVRQSLFPMGVAGLGIILGLAALAGWLRFRNQRSLIALAVFSVALGTVILSLEELLPMLFGQSRVYGYGLTLGAFAVPPSLCLFVLVGFDRERGKWFKILVGVTTAASILSTLALPFCVNPVDALIPWMPFGLSGTLIAAVESVIAARRGNFEARVLTFGLAGLFVTGIMETSAVWGVEGLAGALPFGQLVMFGALVTIVVSRFTDLLRRTEQHALLLQSREEEVHRLGQRLSGGADRLAATVAGLREAAAVQAEVLLKQTAALTETQATAAQIGQTSELTSSKASAVLEAAEQAERSGRSGGEALVQTLSGLEAVRTEVEDMSRRFSGVGERTREIDGVVATVKDIADQTHLLALNARIEAARAGEHGRGFAVVANELGQLAAQSLDATSRIRLALRGVDEAIRSAVQLSEGGSERVEQIVAQTRSSAERLREVAGIATGTGESAREIATAVSQQNAGVGQMLEAIRVLADGFSRANGAMKEADRAAADVQQVASELLTATTSPEG